MRLCCRQCDQIGLKKLYLCVCNRERVRETEIMYLCVKDRESEREFVKVSDT